MDKPTKTFNKLSKATGLIAAEVMEGVCGVSEDDSPAERARKLRNCQAFTRITKDLQVEGPVSDGN